jgi:hypothetical protein
MVNLVILMIQWFIFSKLIWFQHFLDIESGIYRKNSYSNIILGVLVHGVAGSLGHTVSHLEISWFLWVWTFVLETFLFFKITILLWVKCDIYKSSYNIS